MGVPPASGRSGTMARPPRRRRVAARILDGVNGATGDGGSAHLDAHPSRVTTRAELAAALRALRLGRGEPSLRELERRARSPAAVAAGTVALSRTTLSGVLGGDRFPSHEVLVAFLSAVGVVVEAEQREWTAARARLARVREGAPPEEPRSRDRRWWWTAGAGVAAIVVAVVVATRPDADVLTAPRRPRRDDELRPGRLRGAGSDADPAGRAVRDGAAGSS